MRKLQPSEKRTLAIAGAVMLAAVVFYVTEKNAELDKQISKVDAELLAIQSIAANIKALRTDYPVSNEQEPLSMVNAGSVFGKGALFAEQGREATFTLQGVPTTVLLEGMRTMSIKNGANVKTVDLKVNKSTVAGTVTVTTGVQ